MPPVPTGRQPLQSGRTRKRAPLFFCHPDGVRRRIACRHTGLLDLQDKICHAATNRTPTEKTLSAISQ